MSTEHDTHTGEPADSSQLSTRPRRRAPRGARVVGYAVVALLTLVAYYAVNNLLRWGVPFLTDSFSAVLPIISLSLGATFVANLVYMVYDAPWLKHVGQIVLNLISIAATLTVYTIFPFEFPIAAAAQAVRFAFIVVMVLTGLGTLVELAQLLSGR